MNHANKTRFWFLSGFFPVIFQDHRRHFHVGVSQGFHLSHILTSNLPFTLFTAAPTPLSVSRTLTSGTSSVVSSRVSSRANVSDTGSMETVIEARPVLEDDGLKVQETILEARPVVEESSLNTSDTYAAAQVLYFFFLKKFILEILNSVRSPYSERIPILTLSYGVFTDRSIFRYPCEHYFPRKFNSDSHENYAKSVGDLNCGNFNLKKGL